MRTITIAAVLAAGLTLPFALFGAASATKKKPSGKTTTHTTSAKSSTETTRSSSATAKKKSATSHASTSSHKSTTGKNSKSAKHKSYQKSTTAAPRRYVQSAPSPERYMQIQQALADRGYFKGTVDGRWDADSIDALKRFQRDQNLVSDGKISSLSLIGLGLGPKHEPIGDYAAKPASEPPSNP